MPYIDYPLPEHPCREDVWDRLKRETRPIMIYGMGNGADKLFARFEKYGITPREIFASDGFVRGHSFRGMKVRSLSEIKNEYDDFVIVVSFASSRAEVLEIFRELDRSFDVYFPDMPVAGEQYFDREFYNSSYDSIVKAHDSLADSESQECFRAIVNYKLSGKVEYLLSAYSTKEDIYSLINKKPVSSMVDAGAYNGDTLREAMSFLPDLTSVTCIEPDPRNFKKLESFVSSVTTHRVRAINAAAWCENGTGFFSSSGNRNSSVSATASYQHKGVEIRQSRIDALVDYADFVKYDVEGAEAEALVGTSQLIRRARPTLLVSLYHRSEDLFSLINYVSQEYPFYRLYLRRTLCVPAWEIDLIAVCE